ncbi:MAG: substrate-binding domain-containing protein [Pseudomonadota bacterium]
MTESTPSLHRTCIIMLAGCAAALLAACSEEVEQVEPITVVGSSTVYPFAQKVAEDFVAANEGMVAPSIESTGSTDGITAFCAGEGSDTPDIVNASRRMLPDEFAACVSNGVSEIIEIKVGRDGIAFVSSTDDGLDLALTPGIIYRAIAAAPFGGEQTAENWSDVDGSLPDTPIIVYGPPQTSGTRDAMVELVLEAACKTNGSMAALESEDAAAYEANCQSIREDSAYLDQGERDEVIVRKVANNDRAIGVFGYSYLEENSDTIKGLSINGIAPTAETIASGEYPASRPLYIYVKKAHIGVTPGVQEYLNQWSQSWGAEGPLAEIGLVASPAEEMASNEEKVNSLIPLTLEELQGGTADSES